MGLFKDAKQRAQDAMSMGAGAQMPPGMPEMPGGMPDMANMSMPDPAYVAKVNKIGQSGVEAPGEIKAIRPMGAPDMSGAIQHEFDVTIRPDPAEHAPHADGGSVGGQGGHGQVRPGPADRRAPDQLVTPSQPNAASPVGATPARLAVR